MKIKTFFKHIVLIIASFISVFPFIWMLLCTTNKAVDINAGKIMIGGEFMNNLHNLLNSDLQFLGALKNSLMAAVITTVVALLFSSLGAYGFEMFRTKWSERVFSILLLSMMIPFSALMIPLYRMFTNLRGTPFGLDSLFSIVIPYVCTAFLLFFFRSNMKSYPRELLEAGRMDGLNELGIFFRIYFPSAKNVYAAAAILTFMNSWNNYLWPLVAIQSPQKRTLPLVLSAMGSAYVPDYGMIMVGVVIATLPIIVVFFVLQKQFVQGMIGSIK